MCVCGVRIIVCGVCKDSAAFWTATSNKEKPENVWQNIFECLRVYACLEISVCVCLCVEKKPKTRNSWGKPAMHTHTHAHTKLKKRATTLVQGNLGGIFCGWYFYFWAYLQYFYFALMNEWSIEWISVVCVRQFLKFFKLTLVVVVVLPFKYMHTYVYMHTYEYLLVCMHIFMRVCFSCVCVFYSACAAFQRCLLTLK